MDTDIIKLETVNNFEQCLRQKNNIFNVIDIKKTYNEIFLIDINKSKIGGNIKSKENKIIVFSFN